MDAQEFQASAKRASQLIVDYVDNLPNMNIANRVSPGFLENQLEAECPSDGSSFAAVMADLNKVMDGMTHRSSPHFHSELPVGSSYPSMVSEILIAGLNNVSLNWEASPAATELEVIVLNWLAEMIDLPREFIVDAGSSGGGVFQNTCAESTLLSLLSARTRAIEQYHSAYEEEIVSERAIIRKLIFYSSALAKATAERISKITNIKLRHLVPNAQGHITVETINEAYEDDTAQGLIPCMYISTMGTTALMSYDDLSSIGPWCQAHSVWLHLDANYTGMALICPELRSMSTGIEHVDSLAVGMHRLLMSQDVVAYWMKDGALLTAALSVDPLYLRHKHVGSAHDYLNWQIGTGRKFKALKVWMTMKAFGVEGMQAAVRKQVAMAQEMQELITKDNRLELVACHLGVVTFRLRAENNLKLQQQINENGRISLGLHEIDNEPCLQFIANQNMTQEDLTFAWEEIKTQLSSLS